MPAKVGTDGSPHRISVLTYTNQSPFLPSHVPQTGIEHKTSDFSAASLQSAFAGQDLVISTMAGGDYDLQVRIIDAAVAARVKRFIPHEFAQDNLNGRLQLRTPRSVEHAKVIRYLRRASASTSSFEWVAVATGCTLDAALVNGELGFDMEWQSASIHGTGNELFAASSLKRVGVVVASIIRNWDECKNRYLYAAGVFASANEVLASLESSSASKWSVGYSSVDECIREGSSRIERGFPDSGMFLLEKSVLCDKSLRSIDAFQDGRTNTLLQLGLEKVDTIVRKAHHGFLHRGKPSCGCG